MSSEKKPPPVKDTSRNQKCVWDVANKSIKYVSFPAYWSAFYIPAGFSHGPEIHSTGIIQTEQTRSAVRSLQYNDKTQVHPFKLKMQKTQALNSNLIFVPNSFSTTHKAHVQTWLILSNV